MLKGVKHCWNLRDNSFIFLRDHSEKDWAGKRLYSHRWNLRTAHDIFYLYKEESTPQPIEMQISKNTKTFSELFAVYLKSTYIYENFGKKDEPHNWYISEMIDSERRGYLSFYKGSLHNTSRQSIC